MFCKFKIVCFYLKVISCLLLVRKFGNIVHDLAAKYERELSIADFRHWEKISIKVRKAQLDVNFLKNCRSLRVFPKFISFSLPNTSPKDVTAIRKRLLRSAIERRSKELKKLEAERERISNKLRNILNSMDFYLLQNALHSNIRKSTSKVIETHAKKLKGLTRFTTLPFKAEETVTNISSVKLTSEQLGILKNGLTHSICPPYINKSDVYTCFELIHQSVLRNIIRELKQRPRRRQRERHKFAYLVGKNNSFARPARAFFTLVHFFAVVSKTTT